MLELGSVRGWEEACAFHWQWGFPLSREKRFLANLLRLVPARETSTETVLLLHLECQ